MIWGQLALSALAIFFVWEIVLKVMPYHLPVIVQAALLVGMGWVSQQIDQRWIQALALASVVLLLHRYLGESGSTEPWYFRLPRRSESRIRGVGSRIPGLPT